MNELRTSVDGLKEEAVEMQEFIESPFMDDVNSWMLRGNQLCEYMARSGKCLADAKSHLADKKKAYITEDLIKILSGFGVSATAQKELINNACGDLESLVTWFDRINRTCTHQVEYIRSLISKEKAEMQLNNMRTH
ncbi:MAG: hypothetical protein CVU09_00390 [Bacteroidetes bacterium HGW-Bacteroidetes-4]|jgi:hypothetical protein|nr:MAG: hypothetical protein CVU09_00390 [Bacteroidetes bacterium HGW-Bacteroidetes-4]